MQIKLSDLTGIALDWAVMEAKGQGEWFLNYLKTVHKDYIELDYGFCSNWCQSGKLLNDLIYINKAEPSYDSNKCVFCIKMGEHNIYGDTLMEATARAYAFNQLGDKINIPDELANY